MKEKLPEFPITTGMEIIKRVESEPPLKMLWGDIPENSVGLIVGQAKTGKTTFAENLAMSLAIGREEFFGQKLEGKPKRVLFMNFEESYRLRGRRNKKQLEALTPEEQELFAKNYCSTPDGFPEFLNKKEDWEIAKDYIDRVNPEVVFMDSITRMCVGEIERSAIAQTFFKLFHEYIVSDDRTFICIHHTMKNNKEPINMNLIGGSRVVTQEFQYAFGMSSYPQSGGKRYGAMLSNKYEEFDPDKAFVYTIDDTGWVHFIEENKANYLFYGRHETPIDGRMDTTNRNRIVEYMKSTTSPDSPTISSKGLEDHLVRQEGNMSRSTLFDNLKTLAENGEVVKESPGSYRLSNIEDESEEE